MARRKLFGAALAAWKKKRGLGGGKKRRRRSRSSSSHAPRRRRSRRRRSSAAHAPRRRRSSRRRGRRVSVSVRVNRRRRSRRRRNPSAYSILSRLSGGAAPSRKRSSRRRKSSGKRKSSARRSWRPKGRVYRPSIYRRRPSGRARRHLRAARKAGFRFNPSRGGMFGLKSLLSLGPWQTGLTVAAGAGLALTLPGMIASKTGFAAIQSGWGAVAFRGVVSVVACGLAGSLAKSPRLGASLLSGAMAVVAVDALRQISALQPVTQYLPTFGMSGLGWGGYGVNQYLALQGMRGMGNPIPYAGINGLGAPITAGQLVANQAYYGGPRGINEFLQLNAIGAGAIPQARQIALETAGGVY